MLSKKLIYILPGALFLMVSAFFNGYPIVYSDTSTYLASGFEIETPVDRPITYGLFLGAASLNGLSLWLVIFFQALILSYLIFQLFKLIFGEKKYLTFGIITIGFLSVLTGVSWSAGQLLPDIFTSIAVLCMILILFGSLSKKESILMYSLFFLSIAMHMSHLILFSLMLAIIFVLRSYILPGHVYPWRNKQIVIMFVLTWATIISMGAAMSKSRHIFFMGSMVDKGIIKEYLDEKCGSTNYKLCTYKDSMPTTFNDFVWNENSPLPKMGGWKLVKTEFNDIITGVLTQPRYIGMMIKQSIIFTFRQLIHFGIGDGNGSFLQGTRLYERLSKYFNHEIPWYSASKQNQLQMGFVQPVNMVYTVVVATSFILLIILLIFFNQYFSPEIKSVFFVIILAIFFSAATNATFSMVAERFGCKMMWMVPFMAIIGIIRVIHTMQRTM